MLRDETKWPMIQQPVHDWWAECAPEVRAGQINDLIKRLLEAQTQKEQK